MDDNEFCLCEVFNTRINPRTHHHVADMPHFQVNSVETVLAATNE